MTHVVSFLILHEITAVVPLVGLAGLFHWTGWVPDVIPPFFNRRKLYVYGDDEDERMVLIDCAIRF